MTASNAGRRRIIRRMIVTVTTGGLAYLVTNIAQQSQISAITLSVFIGGVVLVVQFLIEFENRLAAVESGQTAQVADVRGLVEERFAKVSEATELFGRVEATPLRDDVVKLARNAIQLGQPPELVRDLARAEVDRVAQFLAQLGGGSQVSYAGEDRDWLLALTRKARVSIEATSRGSTGPGGEFVDEGQWLTELGQRYLAVQRDRLAVQPDLRAGELVIRRVFLLDSRDLVDDPLFRRVVGQQQEAGIDVRVCDLDTLDGFGINLVEDYILFDRVVAYNSMSHRINKVGPAFVSTSLVLHPDPVLQLAHQFTEIWKRAHELSVLDRLREG